MSYQNDSEYMFPKMLRQHFIKYKSFGKLEASTVIPSTIQKSSNNSLRSLVQNILRNTSEGIDTGSSRPWPESNAMRSNATLKQYF
jgi:hypothetical protein